MSASSESRGREFVRQALLAAWQDEESDAQELLEDLLAEADDAAGELARLAAYDLDPAVHEAAGTLLAVSQQGGLVPPSEAARLADAARPVLLEALENPDLPDERKFLVGPLFMLCGGEMGEQDYAGMFRDFAGMMQSKVAAITADVSDQPPSIDRLLEAMVYDEEDRGGADEGRAACSVLLPLAAPLVERDPAAAAALAGAGVALDIERGPVGEDARMAVQMIAEHPCPRAAFVLRELAAWPGGGSLAAQARQAAEDMERAGVAPRATLDSEFSHGLVTTVDGKGSRMVQVYYRAAEGGLDVASVMCNDEVGVKDAWMLAEHGAEVEAEMAGEDSIRVAPCDLAFARAVLADAWARHEELERPLLGRLFNLLPYFNDQPIQPRRRTPDLGAYGLDQMPRTPDLVEGSERLLDSPCYGILWFACPAAYAFINDVRSKGGPRRLGDEKLVEFITRVAPHERNRLVRRMAVNLEVEALAGRAAERLNTIAARTWLALTERIVPFEEVPFIQTLADMSARLILGNLKRGFHSQGEADALDLERDEPPWDIEDDDEEEEDFFFGQD